MKKISQKEAEIYYSTDTLKMVGKYNGCDSPTKYKCYCGKVFKSNPYNIKHKYTKSCGCYFKKIHHNIITSKSLYFSSDRV